MAEEIFDLCIVGAGIFGCAAARHASAYPNLKVCLIGLDEPKANEIEEREIFSSHYDEGRMVKVPFELPSYQVLARDSINRFRKIEKLSGIKFYKPVGALYVGKKGNRCMKQVEDTSVTVGTELIHLDDQKSNEIMYPFLKLKDDEYGLLNFSGSGIVNPRKMIEAQKMIALQQGCHMITDEVKEISSLEDKCHRIKTVKHGILKSKRILIATGAFTNVNSFDIVPQLEMYVYREKAALIRVSDAEADRLSAMPGIIHRRDEFEIGFYMLPPIQYPNGMYYLKVGSMWPENGKGLQTIKEIKEYLMSPENPEETQLIAERIFQLIPDLKSEELNRKICVTSETPTGFPYVDQVSPTVTVATAGCGWGVTTGEEIGRLAAHLSLTGTWDSSIPKTFFEIIHKED